MCVGRQALLFRYRYLWIPRCQKDLKNRLSVWFKKPWIHVEFPDASSPIGLFCNIMQGLVASATVCTPELRCSAAPHEFQNLP
jgi:hypothetical protein